MANVKISELSPLITVQDADVLPIVDNAITKKVTAAILRSYTEGNSVLLTSAQTIAGIKTFTAQLASSVATGTAPFSVLSTTKVTNLNADLLDGLSSADFQATLSGTGIVKSTAGTISYLTDNSTNWNTAFNDKINSAAVTGSGTNTLTLTQQDAGTITATWVNGTLIREIRNNTGATLTKGTIVYISGATGNKPTVTKAIATGDETSAQTFGFVQNDILNNAEGFVVVIGDLIGVDTSAFTEGDQLYLSSTVAGAFTSVKQYAPNHLVYVGIVTRSHPTLGQIEVNISNGFEMDELHNVAAQNPSNGDILQYVTSTGLWTKVAGSTTNISEGTNLYYTAARFNSAFAGKTTTDLTEGTNLYFTDARARAAITGTTPISVTSGVVSISQANGSTNGYLSSTDWTTFNNKQAAGNYITALTGEASASGPGSSSITLTNSAVIGKVLTGLNVTGGSVSATDSILDAFGKVQNQINSLVGGTIYKGTWNASTNTPTLTSSIGTQGFYYIVSVAGATNLNGITSWNVGDWAIFDGTAWQKVDNTDSVVSVNGLTGAVSLTTSNITEGTNLYYTEGRVDANSNVAANTAARHNAVTLGTANGLSLSTQALSLALASGSTTGALSSTDWTTFNGKQNTITLTTTGTSGAATLVGSTLNIPNYADTDTGITSLNGLTALTQTFAVGTSGTDFGISSATSTHTFNLPTASATNRGALSSADWTTFNNKQNALTNPITGTGTTNYLPKFTGASALGNSALQETTNALGFAVTPSAWVGAKAISVANAGSYYSDGIVFGWNTGIAANCYRTGNATWNYQNSGVLATRIEMNENFPFAIHTAPSGTAGNAVTFTQAMTMTSTGNVGIGTTAPATKVHFLGGGVSTSIGNVGSTATLRIDVANPAISCAIGYLGSDDVYFQSFNSGTNSTKPLFLNPFGGNLLLNTTTNAGYTLDVNGTARIKSTGYGVVTTLHDTSNNGFQFIADGFSGYNAINSTSQFLLQISGSERMRITSSEATFAGNVTINQTAATQITSERGNSNTQGVAQLQKIIRQYTTTGLGTKLIIPFVSQGSLNSTTFVRIIGHSARFNNNSPQGFSAEFALGHLNALANLSTLNSSGNILTIAIVGMNIEITFISGYTGGTADGIFTTIEYMTNNVSWSIDVPNITMN